MNLPRAAIASLDSAANKDGSRLGGSFCFVVYFKLHCKLFSQAAMATVAAVAVGLLHPPGGTTRSTSSGPQVFGSYS
jgi:hypothetical protein